MYLVREYLNGKIEVIGSNVDVNNFKKLMYNVDTILNDNSELKLMENVPLKHRDKRIKGKYTLDVKIINGIQLKGINSSAYDYLKEFGFIDKKFFKTKKQFLHFFELISEIEPFNYYMENENKILLNFMSR